MLALWIILCNSWFTDAWLEVCGCWPCGDFLLLRGGLCPGLTLCTSSQGGHTRAGGAAGGLERFVMV